MFIRSSMKKRISSFIRFYTQFIPLKRNGFIFFLVGSLLMLFLRNEYYGEGSQFTPFLNVFGWLIAVFAIGIIGLGLLYTLFCWLYLIIKAKRVRVDLAVGLEDGQKGVAGEVPVKLSISNVIMPLAGYLKTWLLFDDGELIGPIILNKFSGGCQCQGTSRICWQQHFNLRV